jgi:hypothetical protein
MRGDRLIVVMRYAASTGSALILLRAGPSIFILVFTSRQQRSTQWRAGTATGITLPFR